MDARTSHADGVPQAIGFSGKLGSYIGLALGNLALTIVTLGIYRFWAKTRVRRHLWERTTFQGEPLEYRGRGIEKFIGALIVLAVLIVPLFVISLLVTMLTAGGQPLLGVALYIPLYFGLLYLFGVGVYRSRRYLLSRTAWRGIRGGMVAGGWRYGWRFLKLTLLQVVTLGFARPFVSTQLWNALMDDTRFGSAEGAADAKWQPLYARFLFAYMGALLVYVIAIAVIVTQFGDTLEDLTTDAPPPADPLAFFADFAKLYGVLLLAALTAGLLMVGYHAALLREMFDRTQLGSLGFRFDATAMQLFGFSLANIALVAGTLGLALLIMPFRTWQFYVSHLATVGFLDANTLLQTDLAGPAQGDGLADAFDAASF